MSNTSRKEEKSKYLLLTATDLASGLVHAEYNEHKPGGIKAQKEAIAGNYEDAFNALLGEASLREQPAIRLLYQAAKIVRGLLDKS
jgi:hypothetical protein